MGIFHHLIADASDDDNDESYSSQSVSLSDSDEDFSEDDDSRIRLPVGNFGFLVNRPDPFLRPTTSFTFPTNNNFTGSTFITFTPRSDQNQLGIGSSTFIPRRLPSSYDHHAFGVPRFDDQEPPQRFNWGARPDSNIGSILIPPNPHINFSTPESEQRNEENHHTSDFIPHDESSISLSEEENRIIERLMTLHPNLDRFYIIQVFEACDRDEAQTNNCLISMHGQ
ncbi:Ubiquitin family protein [Histomonas meleagridis]|uniref:Ubiquitin family protein n=1 Tax=Histomonas meleagridis TaxID=135588 RepID=UPI003559837C|nr:Ubiquitin family protein [Histomonas meleagridis]KAH0797752.1 Ubiquitin family protein [Histomonas meleagridis]